MEKEDHREKLMSNKTDNREKKKKPQITSIRNTTRILSRTYRFQNDDSCEMNR